MVGARCLARPLADPGGLATGHESLLAVLVARGVAATTAGQLNHSPRPQGRARLTADRIACARANRAPAAWPQRGTRTMVPDTSASPVGGSMRVPSGRAAAAAVVVGVGVLMLVGRLLPASSPPRSDGATPSTVAVAVVPDVFGQTLAEAEALVHAAGLRATPVAGVSRSAHAVVVGQDPVAGRQVLASIVVGLWTRADVQPNGATRRLRLAAGSATARYPVAALDPLRHTLTVVVSAPLGAEVAVWLQDRPGHRLPVLASSRHAGVCHPVGGQVNCVVPFGAAGMGGPGVWIAGVVKGSAAPAVVEVTVTFTPA